jgi:hypothetical protein
MLLVVVSKICKITVLVFDLFMWTPWLPGFLTFFTGRKEPWEIEQFVRAGYVHCIPFLQAEAPKHGSHRTPLWLVVCPVMQIIHFSRFLLRLSEIPIYNFFLLTLSNIAVTLRLSA